MTAADRDTLDPEVLAYVSDRMPRTTPWTTVQLVASIVAECDAERDRRLAAQTLRDAADALTASPDHARWLRDRADTTEGTHHAND